MQKQFIHCRQPTRFQPKLVIQYLQRVARFREKLAVLVYIVGGQLSRISELLSLQHVNIETNRQRNIFIEDRIITLVSVYHKGFYASNDIKVIHRYMPREVGELLVWYLWLILLFIQQLKIWYYQTTQQSRRDSPSESISGSTSGSISESISGSISGSALRATLGSMSLYMWGSDPGTQRAWTSDRLREILKRKTKIRLYYPIDIQVYCDIAIGISRRWMRPSSQFASDVCEEREAAQTVLDTDTEEYIDKAQWLGYIADL